MGLDAAEEEQFGPYLVYERLGVGGMATVHRALERGIEGFERMVALKRLLPHLAEDASFIKSFVREAKLASFLNHVNIVQIFELGRVGTEYFISMEYIDGRDVRRILRHARKVTGPPAIHVTVGMLLQLCDALDYAHNKVDEDGHPLKLVHRDISPSNLLVTRAGHLKIIDFGIAKAQSSQLRTQTGRVKGKLAYMAPEAITSGKDLDARSDLWAVGVIAHELLTARPLFASKNEYQTLLKVQRGDIAAPSTFNQACPPELDAIVAKALARDPDERFASASEFRDALIQLRIKHSLATGYRDIAGWLDWAFSVEAPSGGFAGNTNERSMSGSAFSMRTPAGTGPVQPRARTPRADEDEAVDIAWGGAEPEDNAGPIVLDDIPDVSEKHLSQPPADPISFGDDIPPPQPSHGAATRRSGSMSTPVPARPASRPSVPSLAGAVLRRSTTVPQQPIDTIDEDLGGSDVDVDLETPPPPDPATDQISLRMPTNDQTTDPAAAAFSVTTDPVAEPMGADPIVPRPGSAHPLDTEKNPVVTASPRVRAATLSSPPPLRAKPPSSPPMRAPTASTPPPVRRTPMPVRETPIPTEASASRIPTTRPSVPPPMRPTPVPPAESKTPSSPALEARKTPSSPALAAAGGKVPTTKPGFAAPLAGRRPTSVPPENIATAESAPISTEPHVPRQRRSANVSIGQAIVERDLKKPSKTWMIVISLLLLGAAATAVTLYMTKGKDVVVPTREAPVEPVAKKVGKLAFIIDPADAKITIEGMPMHDGSPWTTEVPEGDYNITIEREGWKPYLANVTVEANDKQNFRWRLDPMDASSASTDATLILGSNPPGLEVVVDGKPFADKTPMRAQLAPGPHVIVLRDANGAEVFKQSITAKASTTLELSPDIAKAQRRSERARASSQPGTSAVAANAATIDRDPVKKDPAATTGIQSVTTGMEHAGGTGAAVSIPSGGSAATVTGSTTGTASSITTSGTGSTGKTATGTTAGSTTGTGKTGATGTTGSTGTTGTTSGSGGAGSASTGGKTAITTNVPANTGATAKPAAPMTVAPNKVTKLSGETPRLAVGRTDVPAMVSAKVCIDTSGRVTSSDVISKLERHAAADLVDAIAKWKYAPYKDGGAVVPACFVVSLKTK